MRCPASPSRSRPDSELGEVARELAKHGVKTERRSGISPGIAEAIVFTDPKGTLVEIFADYVFAKDDGRRPASCRSSSATSPIGSTMCRRR